jgi:defect-in-organelle-trafficking protein DotD
MGMTNRVKGLGVLFGLASLCGCATTLSSKHPSDSPELADLSARIDAHEVVAAKAWRDYAALGSDDPGTREQRQALLSRDVVEVNYIGKPQALLQTFANRYGYRYVEVGKRIDLATVNVYVRNQTPIDVLRSVGQQIDQGADVDLDRDTKEVRLVYKNVPNEAQTRAAIQSNAEAVGTPEERASSRHGAKSGDLP